MGKVFLTILRMGLVSGYAVLVVLIARRLLRRFPKRYSYLLWSVVFLRLVCPVGIKSPFSLVPDVLFAEAGNMNAIRESVDGSGQDKTGTEADSGAGTGVVGGTGIRIDGKMGNLMQEESLLTTFFSAQRIGIMWNTGSKQQKGDPQGVRSVREERNLPEFPAGEPETKVGGFKEDEGKTDVDTGKQGGKPAANRHIPESALTVSCALWITGILVFWLVWALSLRRFRKKLISSVRVEEDVYETRQITASFVDGIFRPVIYIAPGLSGVERQYVLCHERVHVARKDPFIKAAALFLVSIYWFHPLVWLAFKKMCEDMEMSCDERVVELLGEEIKKGYSGTLLRMAQEADEVSLLAAFGGNEVKSRVKNVLSYQKPKKWLAILLLAAVMTVGCGLGLNPGGNDAKEMGGRPEGDVPDGNWQEGENVSSGFSRNMEEGKAPKDALRLTGKAFGKLPVAGEEDAIYCNLPENVKNWEDIVPLCFDPLYGILYYVDYGGDYMIHAVYNGESQTVLELPGKRLFCREGKLYFLLESYNQFRFEGAKSGNIAEYDPVTGEVKVLADETFTSIVVYQDMIYCRREGEPEEFGKNIYINAGSEWFYFFDTAQLVAAEETEGEYSRDFRRYGEYFLAATLQKSEEDPRFSFRVGTELRKWDGERGAVWDGFMLPDDYYVKDGKFCWLGSKGFHLWDPVSGLDEVKEWKFEEIGAYILAGDWLFNSKFQLLDTGNGNVEKWISQDEELKLLHELYTDGENIYAIVGVYASEADRDSVFCRVQVDEGYKLRFETLQAKLNLIY